jgi:endonuclease/exonuclease/phosphatase family metal-dependent hydrolase
MNPFVLVNLWAHPSPTYEAFVLDALRAVKESLKAETQLVVVGDFNSTPARLRGAHSQLMKVMDEDLSLVSAYHAHHSVPTGGEAHPTHYWQWKQTKPFHIDYVFVPKAWSAQVRSVEVGTFDGWRDSDHRPVVVDIG